MTVLAVSAFMLASTSALAEWYACTPSALGASASLKRLKVSNCNNDPTNGLGWLSLDPTSADQQMATILTAISLNKQVSIEVTTNKDSEGYNIADYVILYNE